MDIKQIYREEKNLEPYTESPNYEDHFSNNYVEWLEAKINYTHCCTELKDKKITDLLNWVKSDLAQETNVKLGKTSTPYRSEKIRFLNKLLEIDNICDKCNDLGSFELGTTCPKCNKSFRSVKQ
ncbi:hypothetical protein [Clostridium sp.]|jgi:hypothetical protein|uniref:hypothetical protein n=1 Tax=Clostridium sp. TaxID=1506 RepID=UPI003EEA2C09